MHARIRRRHCAALLVGALCCSAGAGVAQGASRASLKVTAPKTVHPGQAYKITTKGSYPQSAITGVAFLVEFQQFNSKPCLPTGAGEFNKRNLDASFTGDVPRTPFTHVQHEKANSRLGTRRICAYLYPQSVLPTDQVRPIATATAVYKVVKK